MPISFFILARGDEALMVKVIFGIIFFIIWAISAAVSAVAKKQQEARRRQMEVIALPSAPPRPGVLPPGVANVFAGGMPRGSNAPPPPRRLGMSPGMPPVKTPGKSPPRGGKPPKVKQQARRPSVAPPPLAAAPARSAMQAPPTPTTHQAGGSAGNTTAIAGARAATNPLTKLMNPKALRTLVITNELLQPPVALREQWPPLG